MLFNVAIDGSSGVGKSSIAKKLAQHFNMTHLDTGAMYRCIALYLQDNDVAIESKLKEINIEFKGNEVFLNNENVTTLIRNERISLLASKYAQYDVVREFLVAKQQEIAKKKGYILDGRDIGSVVLPDAEVKFFLEADPLVKAKRRLKEYEMQGQSVTLEEVYEDMKKRDEQDKNRKNAPLIKVEHAILIDTSDKTLDEVVSLAIEYIESKVK